MIFGRLPALLGAPRIADRSGQWRTPLLRPLRPLFLTAPAATPYAGCRVPAKLPSPGTRRDRGASTRAQGGLPPSRAVTSVSPSTGFRDRAFSDRETAEAYLRANRDGSERQSDAQDAEAVRLSANAGLRLGELPALRWSDIDWERQGTGHCRSVAH
jgi:integrase